MYQNSGLFRRYIVVLEKLAAKYKDGGKEF